MATTPTTPTKPAAPAAAHATPPAPKPGTPGAAGEPTGMFTPPPANAPHETTQPLDAATIQTQAEKAHQHERELAPLKFALDKAVASVAGLPGEVQAAPPQAPPDAPAGSAGTASALKEQPPLNSHPTIQAPVIPYQPAASTTDTPSRGLPKPIADPGKRITGGFGEEGGFEPQYYALDGTELLALVETIIKNLVTELHKDLRFGIAVCYPQVAARVTIEIGGAHAAATVNDVAFTVESRILSLSATKMDDNSTPADQLRVDAGLDRPYKRTVRTPTGTFIVDRETVLEPEQTQPAGSLPNTTVAAQPVQGIPVPPVTAALAQGTPTP